MSRCFAGHFPQSRVSAVMHVVMLPSWSGQLFVIGHVADMCSNSPRQTGISLSIEAGDHAMLKPDHGIVAFWFVDVVSLCTYKTNLTLKAVERAIRTHKGSESFVFGFYGDFG